MDALHQKPEREVIRRWYRSILWSNRFDPCPVAQSKRDTEADRGSPQEDLLISTFMSALQMKIGSQERNRRRKTSPRRLGALSLCLAAPLALVGCSHAPEYSIFGSFFPAWIFCAAGGLLLMAGARVLIARTAIGEHLAAPVLLYLSMAIFFTCMLWLLFYS